MMSYYAKYFLPLDKSDELINDLREFYPLHAGKQPLNPDDHQRTQLSSVGCGLRIVVGLRRIEAACVVIDTAESRLRAPIR